MPKSKHFPEAELAALAKHYRKQSGKRKVDVARELEVSRSNVSMAEDNPEQSLTKLRIRMIETYSPYKVVGPVYLLEKK